MLIYIFCLLDLELQVVSTSGVVSKSRTGLAKRKRNIWKCLRHNSYLLSTHPVDLQLWENIQAGYIAEYIPPTLQVLVGGFNPVEKYARQIGSFPQVEVKIKKKWNHHLEDDAAKRPLWPENPGLA